MPHTELVLTIRHALEATASRGVGAFHITHSVRIGRAPENNVVVADATVSREHARIERRGEQWWLVNTSRANGVFLDQVELRTGEDARLPDAPCLVQLGGVLFDCTPSEGTMPVLEALALPMVDTPHAATQAPFRITRDGDSTTLHFNGKLVAMKPLAAAVLACLAEAPAQVVHEWDVLEAVGRDAHIPQAVSEVRRGLRKLVDGGLLAESDVRTWVQQVSADDTDTTLDGQTGADLMRRFVRSKRGHGYCLVAPHGVFRVVDEG